jgi:hypothetical protein
MILRIAAVIVGGLAGGGFITLAAAWYAGSVISVDSKVRRRVQVVEVLMGLAMLSLGTATAQNARERKLFLITIGVIAAILLFRGARLLMIRAKT